MSCGKWACLVAVSELLCLIAVIAQPGFLSIDCGWHTNYTAETNITWVTDVNYINVGETAYTGDATQQGNRSSLHSLRFFPKPLNKSCYQLPVTPNVHYLLRTWFAVGNYTGFQNLSRLEFAFSIETLGMLAVQNVSNTNLTNVTPLNYENVFVSSGSVLYICLIRTSKNNDPFISAIELRTLRRGMYRQAKPGAMLSLESRNALGANSLIRYPEDEFDRLWSPMPPVENTVSVRSQKPISTNNTQDLPPPAVMQTALVSSSEAISCSPSRTTEGTKLSLVLLYFAEIEQLNITETRSFSVYINDEYSEALTLVQNYSAIEKTTFLNTNKFLVQIVRASKSSRGPLLNSLEYYKFVDTAPPTYSEDIEALKAIQRRFGIKSWISDPCYVISWDGIGCDKGTSVRRVSQMNLSGMNLTGSVPQTIGQLTSLVNLSLENNHLTGPLPNFSNLTMLERLHLQDNNLTGNVPDWLSGFKNLRELFIDNNNFTGVLPAQLLCKHSLKIRYSGNHYLHIPSNSNNNKLRLILGTTITGSLVIVLVLTAGVVAHRKGSWRKESSRVEMESKGVVEEDNSMIIVPNTTKFRAFTLEEIMAATQNFSHKIGQGGFGSVFFGKLEQKGDIAVKVLSRLSKQGVQEFLNEVNLLSRVHHRNLVSLLGYHNESRELMLVYEHMPGGSLRDHLYGPTAEVSQLNWKTRLKIALDAANGLEYLHVDCNPKIIHRDIKTANILLDRNFHGKLADFGLSRRTIDGEVSHIITTVKGTLGYLDPEYFSTQTLTEKSDVYSFGVVLLEIISGRQPINAKLPGEQLNLIRWVTPYVEMDENSGKMAEIIDKTLRRNCNIKSITAVAKLAIRCVQARQSSRPSASEVVAELKEAIKIEEDKISEIDIEYGELGANSACLSPDSSGTKEMYSVESISNAPTKYLLKNDKFT